MTTTSHRPTADTTHLVGGMVEVGEGEEYKMFLIVNKRENN